MENCWYLDKKTRVYALTRLVISQSLRHNVTLVVAKQFVVRSYVSGMLSQCGTLLAVHSDVSFFLHAAAYH